MPFSFHVNGRGFSHATRPAGHIIFFFGDDMRPAAAFGKPFTYLAAAPSPPPPSSSAAADHRQSQPPQQTPVSASVLHTFTAIASTATTTTTTTNGGGNSGAPTPPVRTSTAAAKQKPPPVPPRGEQTRLTTVPAKKPSEPVVQSAKKPSEPVVVPSAKTSEPTVITSLPPPPPPLSPPPPQTIVSVDDDSSPPPPLPQTTVNEPDEDLSASALISKFENGCAVKPVVTSNAACDHKPPVEVDSGTSTLAESTDDDENGVGGGDDDDDDDGAADIWVRTIESPVKNLHSQKVRHHSDSAIKAVTAVSSSPLAEKRGSLPADTAVAVDKKSSPPLSVKDSTYRSSFRSSAGSRCSSPALVNNQQNKSSSDSGNGGGGGGRKISAAEALGVVAKPCPRILPSSASLDAACRRQSLGNLTESRFGTLLSSSVRSSWAPPSGVQTDVESTQSEPSFDYRRKKFTKRCSSADGRNPVHHHHHHHHYHTLSSTRVTAARDPDFGAKRAFIQEKLQAASTKLQNAGIVPSGLPPTPPPPLAYQQQNGSGTDCGRPPRSSSCNCGQHQATSRPMFINKRTVSAEDLLPPPATVTVAEPDQYTATGRTVSTSSSSSSGGRGSFGRSQRVTFALDQHQQLFGSSQPPGAAEPTATSAIKKPFKSNLKVKEANAVPELNVLGTSAINTRLPPQHPHPYGLPYKLPVVNTDVLQVVQIIIIILS